MPVSKWRCFLDYLIIFENDIDIGLPWELRIRIIYLFSRPVSLVLCGKYKYTTFIFGFNIESAEFV